MISLCKVLWKDEFIVHCAIPISLGHRVWAKNTFAFQTGKKRSKQLQGQRNGNKRNSVCP